MYRRRPESWAETQHGEGDSLLSRERHSAWEGGDRGARYACEPPAPRTEVPGAPKATRRRLRPKLKASERGGGGQRGTRKPEEPERTAGFEKRRGAGALRARHLSLAPAPAEARHPGSWRRPAKKHPSPPSSRPRAPAGEAGLGAPQSAREQHSPGSPLAVCCAQLLRGPRLGATVPHPPLRPRPPPPAPAPTPGLRGTACVRAPVRRTAWRERAARACAPRPRAGCLPEPGLARSVRGPAAAAGRPTGALGQLPPRTRNSLLLLKNPPKRVYVGPYKLPARAFTIYEKSEPVLGKRGTPTLRGQPGGFSVCACVGGGPLGSVWVQTGTWLAYA
ncbi:sterile alpha motif domain-containing protein 1-like [Leopardus geoffroyi]|uniref:sterile alpha motif domain-containing protein 1-like n=1 Tax=Leopardus geoffroyi TaxID=46844 RepID=UPI001E260DD7|nr:sterile alpha motif domain-containing protein 1-like [Leopardus geoffroyi]